MTLSSGQKDIKDLKDIKDFKGFKDPKALKNQRRPDWGVLKFIAIPLSCH